MLRYEKDDEGNPTSMRFRIDGPLAARIKLEAAKSSTTAASWVREALEFMLMEHRAGRYRPDPNRFDNRNGEDYGQPD